MTTPVVKLETFSALSKLYSKGPFGLAAIVRSILQVQAKNAASLITVLTDSSTGTSGGNTVGAVPSSLAVTVGGGSVLAPKAGWDTDWAEIRNGVATLAAQYNAIQAVIPVGAITDSTGGTSGGATVGAISHAMAAVDGTASNALAQAQVTADAAVLQANISELTFWVNKLCTATGTTPLVDSTGAASVLRSGTLVAMHASSAAGVDGTGNSVLNTVANTFLTDAANAIATLAAKLNAIVAHSGGYLVLGAVAG
jgi:hypothetical protein